MWDDDISWQYHQDSRDAAANEGAIALFALIGAVIIAGILLFVTA